VVCFWSETKQAGCSDERNFENLHDFEMLLIESKISKSSLCVELSKLMYV
jgi:hypothetical protein